MCVRLEVQLIKASGSILGTLEEDQVAIDEIEVVDCGYYVSFYEDIC
jgi:hypothetical protein